MPEDVRNRIFEALLFNASLAVYCNRPDHLQDLFKAAKNIMTKEQYATFTRMISEVQTGELPFHEFSSLRN